MSHTLSAGPEAGQPLGILHWDPADGETKAKYTAHVYQILFCPLFPEWQCISRGSLQLWNIISKCIHFCDVNMNLNYIFGLCVTHTFC